jgi:hypothetical protein
VGSSWLFDTPVPRRLHECERIAGAGSGRDLLKTLFRHRRQIVTGLDQVEQSHESFSRNAALGELDDDGVGRPEFFGFRAGVGHDVSSISECVVAVIEL